MPERRARLDDEQAHERAVQLLTQLLGCDCSDRVCWDPDHILQGHVDLHGDHLVVIAPRDEDHCPRVLSEADWDALRHGVAAGAC